MQNLLTQPIDFRSLARFWERLRTWLSAQDQARILLLLAIAALITFARRHGGYDDAFITYRYAYNFATGHGLLYNPGERYLGTSAPVYALLLGLLGHFRPESIPLLGNLISGLCLAGIAVLLLRIGRLLKSPTAGFFAGLLFVTQPLCWHTFGGEMLAQTLLVLGSLYALLLQRSTLATLLLCGASLIRPDALMMLPLVLVILWRREGRFPARPALLALLLLLPFAVAAWLTYGQVLPGTLAAKQAQVQAGGDPFVIGAVKWLPKISKGSPAYYLPFVLALLGFLFPRKLFTWKMVLLWPLTFLGVYVVLGIPFYHWYLVPVLLGVAILGGIGIEGLCSTLERSPLLLQQIALALLIGAFLIVAFFPLADMWRVSVGDRKQQLAYLDAVAWVNANTVPTDTIGYYEIGILGYYTHRAIVDPFGLITPGAADFIAQGDYNGAFRTRLPNWILVSPGFRGRLDERATWFKRNYRLYTIFPESTCQSLRAYRRIQPGKQAGR